jgi:hypothetical protein
MIRPLSFQLRTAADFEIDRARDGETIDKEIRQ